MKLSVIITVYNCDKYISRCLESVNGQTVKDFEVIIVDDGSVDQSARICDEFVRGKGNAKVIHKTNGGTVSARKAGIEAATGEVVCFIDGDDWIDKDFCAKLICPFIDEANIDVVSSGLCFEYVSNAKKNYILLDGTSEGLIKKEELSKVVLPNFFYDFSKDTAAITSSICCKMMKKNIALSAIDDMDEQLTIGEDGAFVMAVLLRSRNIYIIKDAYYHYEQHADSQNYRFELGAYEQLKRLQICMRKIALKFGQMHLLKEQIEYYIKGYLRNIGRSVFDIEEDGRLYLFPSELIAEGSKIVIHGAGKVGCQYVKYVKKTKKYKLVGWTDKNKGQSYGDADVPCLVSEISKMCFDYVVLAANDNYVLEQMEKDLYQYNIPVEKMVVTKPISYKL